jgi:hypothetical protein
LEVLADRSILICAGLYLCKHSTIIIPYY